MSDKRFSNCKYEDIVCSEMIRSHDNIQQNWTTYSGFPSPLYPTTSGERKWTHLDFAIPRIKKLGMLFLRWTNVKLIKRPTERWFCWLISFRKRNKTSGKCIFSLRKTHRSNWTKSIWVISPVWKACANNWKDPGHITKFLSQETHWWWNIT